MARTAKKPVCQRLLPPALPGWGRTDAPVTTLDEAAFRAGAALAALDARVGADLPFAGVWRRRLALKAAAASARMARRVEDEAMLRDAFFLRHSSDDPGPAGRLLVAWRSLDRSAPPRNSSPPAISVLPLRPPRPHTPAAPAAGRYSEPGTVRPLTPLRARTRFLEFFAANIRNPPTRRAYSRAVGEFLAWCADAPACRRSRTLNSAANFWQFPVGPDKSGR